MAITRSKTSSAREVEAPTELPKKKLTKEQRARRKAKRLAKDLPSVQEVEHQIEQRVLANPQEQEHLDEYLNMFRTLRKMCRKAKAQCMKSGQSRDYYAYCTLLSQQREVINDIRSVSDMSQQVTTLDTNVLQPLVRSLGQNLLDAFYQMRALLGAVTVKDQTQFALKKQNEIMTEQSRYMQQQYNKALEQLTNALMGNGK